MSARTLVGALLTGAGMFFTAAAARVALDGDAGGSTWGVVGLALVLVFSEGKVDGPAYVGWRTIGAGALGQGAALLAIAVATDAIMVALCAAFVCLALGSARRTLVGWAGHRAAGTAAVIWAPAFLGYGVGPLLGITGVVDAAAVLASIGLVGTIAALGFVLWIGETTEGRDGAE
jgi:hypothetical protein